MLGVPHHTAMPMNGIRRPPVMASIAGRPHDSILYTPGMLSPGRYREFIVYDKAQTYPEFLIEYERA